MAGPDLGPLARGRDRHDAGAAAALDEQVEREPVLVDGDGGLPHRRHQRPLHLDPGRCPAGVHDAGVRVPALPGQQQLAVGVAVEDGPEGDELVDPPRALLDEDPHGVLVAQAGAGGEGVGQVQVGRVGVAAEHGRDAALRPARRRLVELALGQHADPQAVHVRGPDGRREPGDAGAEDQQVQRAAAQFDGTST